MRDWTEKELSILRREYPNTPTKALAKKLRRSVSSVYNAVFIHGLKKSDEYLASLNSGRWTKFKNRGYEHRFPKGHSTWNKGMRYVAGGRSAQTRFKPGNRPQTWRPIGSERIDKDGILWRKLTDTRKKTDWKAVHVIVWEQANGPLPPGKFVVFVDRNRQNFDIDNLIAVSRAENLARNTVHRYPPALRRAIQLRGVLNRQINKREHHAE